MHLSAEDPTPNTYEGMASMLAGIRYICQHERAKSALGVIARNDVFWLSEQTLSSICSALSFVYMMVDSRSVIATPTPLLCPFHALLHIGSYHIFGNHWMMLSACAAAWCAMQAPVLDKVNAVLEDTQPGWFEPIYLKQDRPESAGLLQQCRTGI